MSKSEKSSTPAEASKEAAARASKKAAAMTAEKRDTPVSKKPGKEFDLDELHKEAQARITARKNKQQRGDDKDHFVREWDMNVKASYEKSLHHAKSDLQKKHLETVLAAGAAHLA